VYVYEPEDGYQIHVAKGRHESDEPIPTPPDSNAHAEDYVGYMLACLKWAERAEIKPIGLPCDGKSYGFDTPAECAEKLIELRGMGYNVPQRAIDALLEEAK